MSKGGGSAPTETKQTVSNLPEFAEPFYRDLLARVGYESAVPYETYPGQRLEYFAPAEQEAMRRFEQLGVSGTPDELVAAGDIAARVAQEAGSYTPTMLEVTKRAQEQPAFVSGLQASDVYSGYDPTGIASEYAAGQRQVGYDPGTLSDQAVLQKYMDPYQQLVVEREKEEARRQSQIMEQQMGLQAAGIGSLGGYREAIMQAERQRNLEDQLGDIQARGSQAAFQQAVRGFEADRAGQAQLESFAQQQRAANEAARRAQSELGLSAYGATQQARQQAARLGLDAAQIEQAGRIAAENARREAEAMNLAQARAAAQLGQSAYSQILGGGQQRLAAAGMLGDFVGQRQAQEMERLRAMQTAGQIQRELAQRGLDVGYTDFLRQQAFPKEQLAFYSSMLQGLPIAPGQVSQTYGVTPSTTQQLLGAGIAGVGLYNALGGFGG